MRGFVTPSALHVVYTECTIRSMTIDVLVATFQGTSIDTLFVHVLIVGLTIPCVCVWVCVYRFALNFFALAIKKY